MRMPGGAPGLLKVFTVEDTVKAAFDAKFQVASLYDPTAWIGSRMLEIAFTFQSLKMYQTSSFRHPGRMQEVRGSHISRL